MPLKTKGGFSSPVAFGLSKRRSGRNSSCLMMPAWSISGLPGAQSPPCLWDLSPSLLSGCQLTSVVILCLPWALSDSFQPDAVHRPRSWGNRNHSELIVGAGLDTMYAGLGHSHPRSQRCCLLPKRRYYPTASPETVTAAGWVGHLGSDVCWPLQASASSSAMRGK